jgi:DNA-binding XRE family transcriptional regulator
MKCDVCNSKETYVKEHEQNYIVKDKEVNFKANRRFCKNCDALIYDEKLDNEASKLAIDKYNEIYGLSKDKILEFRNKYKISLDLLSKVIGCAKKTLINYEMDFDGNYETHTITAIKSSSNELFDNKELSTLKKVKDFFTSYTSSRIATYSHQEKAWLESVDGQSISYKYALELSDIEKNNA